LRKSFRRLVTFTGMKMAMLTVIMIVSY
jgi:hypothetical protein